MLSGRYLKRNIILSLVYLFLTTGPVDAEDVKRRVVGLVEIPGVFGRLDPNGPPGLILPANVKAVPIYSDPSSKSPVIGEIEGLESVETKEFDYEAHAAVVYKIINGWGLVHVTDKENMKFGWISLHEQGPFHPLVKLFNTGLCYLKKDWDGVLYKSINTLKSIKRFQVDGKRWDISIVRSEYHQGVLWFEIKLLGPGRCKGGNNKALDEGWIPAYKNNGELNIWFYSRGC